MNSACYPSWTGSRASGAVLIQPACWAWNWARLAFDTSGVGKAFQEAVVDPIRRMANRTIDLPTCGPGPASTRRARQSDGASTAETLFGDATLQDLPDAPRFVINATSLQSGVLWRFFKPYMWDYRGTERVSSLEQDCQVGT